MIGAISTGQPPMCTGTIIRVRGVIFRATSAGSRLIVARIEIGQHHLGPDRQRVDDRGDEGDGRHDHLVARPQAGHLVGDLEAGRGVGQEQRMLDAEILLHGLFELLATRLPRVSLVASPPAAASPSIARRTSANWRQ